MFGGGVEQEGLAGAGAADDDVGGGDAQALAALGETRNSPAGRKTTPPPAAAAALIALWMAVVLSVVPVGSAPYWVTSKMGPVMVGSKHFTAP